MLAISITPTFFCMAITSKSQVKLPFEYFRTGRSIYDDSNEKEAFIDQDKRHRPVS